MAPELSPTSYAILGLLDLRPWTTYELAQQMDRALGLFWPRARSKLYEEPKKLVAHGLAIASSEMVGKRPRTVYTITPEGRRALAEWVPAPGDGPVLEYADLVKVFFAEHGSKDDLLAVIERARAWCEDRARLGVGIARGYLNGEGPFPERLAWIILVGQFLDDFNTLVAGWADWAEGVIAKWPDDIRGAEPDLAALEAMARHSEEYLERRRMASPGRGAS